MARLLPIYTINSEILFQKIEQLIHIIHNCKGFVYLVLCDNLRAKQKTFKLFQYGSEDIFAVTHPVLRSDPSF